MPEEFPANPITVPKSNIFNQRRQEIYRRLQECCAEVKLNYGGRKELASEKDEIVADLLEVLEDCFGYGLRQQNATIQLTATSLFQNMHEIVTGSTFSSNSNDTTFWDFCQIHLTAHERERYENLKHIWTKYGRGRAFIRATLNENSLHRYVATWLSNEIELQRYYTHWSLFLDVDASKHIPEFIASLNEILFALNVDTTELNVRQTRSATALNVLKEEPIIYAPTPAPVAETKQKRKSNIVERPIATSNSTEDLFNTLKEAPAATATILQQPVQFVPGNIEMASNIKSVEVITSPDPIEPELEFLKTPLPDFYPENHTVLHVSNGTNEQNSEEDKSETSSQYSNKSSTVTNSGPSYQNLEEQLRKMTERCDLLETRVAKLSLENRQLVRRLTKYFEETGIDPSSSLATNFLITIPQMKLLKSKRNYYVYEIHVTMRKNLEHWVLLRRYREFYKLHKSLLRTHPSIASVEFPPKKHFGNMNLAFVEERRQQLQIYLINLIEALPQVEACKSKVELQKAFPFLRETTER